MAALGPVKGTARNGVSVKLLVVFVADTGDKLKIDDPTHDRGS